jgi:hypothetical protein
MRISALWNAQKCSLTYLPLIKRTAIVPSSGRIWRQRQYVGKYLQARAQHLSRYRDQATRCMTDPLSFEPAVHSQGIERTELTVTTRLCLVPRT